MSKKLNIELNKDKFPQFLQYLEDLAKISDTIKLKIDSQNILMYSIVGETILLAFKSYLVHTKEYLTSKEDIEMTLDIIVTGSKKFVKNLGFINGAEKISMVIDYRPSDDDTINTARFLNIKNGKLKIALQGGEQSEIKDISKEVLEKRVNIKNSKWSFKIQNTEFQDIKKLSSINSDGKIIHLNVESGKVVLSETSTWEFQVDEVSGISDRHLMFKKSFLSSINDDSDVIEFFIFDSFVLTKDESSHLMISFEQDFSVDD
jgi:hypothetical protein